MLTGVPLWCEQVQIYSSYPAVAPQVVVTAIKEGYLPARSLKTGRPQRQELSHQEVTAVQQQVRCCCFCPDMAIMFVTVYQRKRFELFITIMKMYQRPNDAGVSLDILQKKTVHSCLSLVCLIPCSYSTCSTIHWCFMQ